MQSRGGGIVPKLSKPASIQKHCQMQTLKEERKRGREKMEGLARADKKGNERLGGEGCVKEKTTFS